MLERQESEIANIRECLPYYYNIFDGRVFMKMMDVNNVISRLLSSPSLLKFSEQDVNTFLGYCQSLTANNIGNIAQTKILIEKAIELIFNAVHQNKGKVVVSGLGKAGQIGHNIATTLSSTGTPAIFLHPTEAQHGDLGMIQKDDILFLISNSGKTKEILELLPLAKRLYPGIKSIALTGHPVRLS